MYHHTGMQRGYSELSGRCTLLADLWVAGNSRVLVTLRFPRKLRSPFMLLMDFTQNSILFLSLLFESCEHVGAWSIHQNMPLRPLRLYGPSFLSSASTR